MKRTWAALAAALLAAASGCEELVAVGQIDVAQRDNAGVEADASFSTRFDGTYELDGAADEPTNEKGEANVLALTGPLFSPLRVNRNVLRYGKLIEGEFRLTSGAIKDGVLHGPAIWHEDVHDPGDCTEGRITLEQDGDLLRLSWFDPEEGPEGEGLTLVYRKTSR